LLVAERVKVEIREAPVNCELSPTVPQLPLGGPGKGAIIGEIIVGGVPESGACGTGRPNTVSVENEAGTLIAQSVIAGRQSFAFDLPPGSYTLLSGPHEECRGSAVVVAVARITHADIFCPVP
jgi:hypothetical protein